MCILHQLNSSVALQPPWWLQQLWIQWKVAYKLVKLKTPSQAKVCIIIKRRFFTWNNSELTSAPVHCIKTSLSHHTKLNLCRLQAMCVWGGGGSPDTLPMCVNGRGVLLTPSPCKIQISLYYIIKLPKLCLGSPWKFSGSTKAFKPYWSQNIFGNIREYNNRSIMYLYTVYMQGSTGICPCFILALFFYHSLNMTVSGQFQELGPNRFAKWKRAKIKMDENNPVYSILWFNEGYFCLYNHTSKIFH